jgi:hypothetical protein
MHSFPSGLLGGQAVSRKAAAFFIYGFSFCGASLPMWMGLTCTTPSTTSENPIEMGEPLRAGGKPL